MEINWKALKIEVNKKYEAFEEIIEDLKFLYTTPVGSIPLNRDFGIEQDFLSYPEPIAKNMLSVEVIKKTEQYEPRVFVESVTFKKNDETIIPVIQISMLEGD